MPTRVTLLPEGAAESITVALERDHDAIRWRVGGQTAGAGSGRMVGETEGVIQIGERTLPFFAVRSADGVDIWIDGETYRFRLPEEGRRAAAGALPANGEVLSPMPGTVLKVLVEPGAKVAAQQPLIVLESMKMELTLSAPAAGEVAEVRCRPGELVDVGVTLLRIAPQGDSTG
jgi:acetyl/propionyl-CoA carboxylase alpha subunit